MKGRLIILGLVAIFMYACAATMTPTVMKPAYQRFVEYGAEAESVEDFLKYVLDEDFQNAFVNYNEFDIDITVDTRTLSSEAFNELVQSLEDYCMDNGGNIALGGKIVPTSTCMSPNDKEVFSIRIFEPESIVVRTVPPTRQELAAKECDYNIADTENVSGLFTIQGEPVNGLVCRYYEDGQVETLAAFAGGEQTGLTRIYKNGQVRSEVLYNSGKRDGMSKGYDENGQLTYEGNYKNDEREGTFITYAPYKGEENYKNGKLDGVYKVYHKNGNLREEALYKNGLKEGAGKFYYENGQVEQDSIYENNQVTGLTKFYNENGRLVEESFWKKGTKNGLMKLYYEDGKLQQESMMKNHKFDGFLKGYYQSGALESETTFKNGLQEGLRKVYHENGRLASEVIYKNDKRNGAYKAYDQYDGSLILTVTYKDGEIVRGVCARDNRRWTSAELANWINGLSVTCN